MTPVQISHLVKQPDADGRRLLLRSISYGNRVKLACRCCSSRSLPLQPLASSRAFITLRFRKQHVFSRRERMMKF